MVEVDYLNITTSLVLRFFLAALNSIFYVENYSPFRLVSTIVSDFRTFV